MAIFYTAGAVGSRLVEADVQPETLLSMLREALTKDIAAAAGEGLRVRRDGVEGTLDKSRSTQGGIARLPAHPLALQRQNTLATMEYLL